MTAEGVFVIKVDHWTIPFYHLPNVLPILSSQLDEQTSPQGYRFDLGVEAMKLLLAREPEFEYAERYRQFLAKWPLYERSQVAMQAGQWDEARTALHEALQIDPEDPSLYFHLGQLERTCENYPAAIAAYEQTLSLMPSLLMAHINLARCYQATGDFHRAREAYQQAFKVDPTDPFVQEMLRSHEQPDSA